MSKAKGNAHMPVKKKLVQKRTTLYLYVSPANRKWVMTQALKKQESYSSLVDRFITKMRKIESARA